MKTKTIKAEIKIKLLWDEYNPYTLRVEGPYDRYVSGEGGDIYFSETDGTSLAEVLVAIEDELPEGADIESNNRECWVEHWDDDALRALNGRTFTVRFSQIFEVAEDGELCWLEDKAELVK